MAKGFFITGTDTEIGKTTVTVALLHTMAKSGYRVVGYKPVATGCDMTPEGLRNEDAELMVKYASVPLAYDRVNPFAFPEPVSPHIAAAHASASIAVEPITKHFQEISNETDWVLVEGAGGWLVPINDTETMADVAQSIGLPVILVIGIRLGCINHALLTADAIRASGLKLAGWVGNILDRRTESVPEILDTIRVRIGARPIGIIPPFRNVNVEKIGDYLDLNILTDS